MNKNLKLVGLLAGIFVTGSVTGALLTTRFGRDWLKQRAARGEAGPPHAVQPLYVRRPDAELERLRRGPR